MKKKRGSCAFFLTASVFWALIIMISGCAAPRLHPAAPLYPMDTLYPEFYPDAPSAADLFLVDIDGIVKRYLFKPRRPKERLSFTEKQDMAFRPDNLSLYDKEKVESSKELPHMVYPVFRVEVSVIILQILRFKEQGQIRFFGRNFALAESIWSASPYLANDSNTGDQSSDAEKCKNGIGEIYYRAPLLQNFQSKLYFTLLVDVRTYCDDNRHFSRWIVRENLHLHSLNEFPEFHRIRQAFRATEEKLLKLFAKYYGLRVSVS